MHAFFARNFTQVLEDKMYSLSPSFIELWYNYAVLTKAAAISQRFERHAELAASELSRIHREVSK